jgi:hypothetical protein
MEGHNVCENTTPTAAAAVTAACAASVPAAATSDPSAALLNVLIHVTVIPER